MLKRLFVVSFLCVAVLPVTFAANPSDDALPDSRPNILMIFTDDHAYQSISAYGSNRNGTPNMGRLANEGMRFTNCVVPNSLCGPCRAVIQTGKYSHVNGFIDNNSKFDISQQTFPKLLQQAGYQTAIVGKWHLECDARPGYDYSEVLIGQGPYFNPPMIKNGEQVKHEGYTTEIITGLTLDWLDHRDKSKPFLMMCQHKAPHREWDPIKKHYDKFDGVVFPEPPTLFDDYSGRGRAAIEQDMTIADTMTPRDLKLKGMPANLNESQKAMWQEMFAPRIAEFERLNLAGDDLTRWKYQCYMRDYLSCIDAVDESVGRVLQYLDDNGLTDNTIVVYASDQGFYLGEHGWFDKRFMFNESFKTPLLVRWPGKTKPGSVNDDIVSLLDLPETFLEAAGVAIPDDMQGLSLVSVLEGKTPDDWRKTFYYHYYEYPAVHMVKRHEGVYDGRFKLIHFYNDIDEWELYDSETDPLEMQNVIAQPQYKDDVVRLRAELGRLRQELNVPDNVVATDAPLTHATPNRPYINRLRTVIQEREARQAKQK
ncbi:MAG: sulfatase [Planctomycetaceae bacterium]|nr:sulfatase [Planctomycetaceae bacterium]